MLIDRLAEQCHATSLSRRFGQSRVHERFPIVRVVLHVRKFTRATDVGDPPVMSMAFATTASVSRHRFVAGTNADAFRRHHHVARCDLVTDVGDDAGQVTTVDQASFDFQGAAIGPFPRPRQKIIYQRFESCLHGTFNASVAMNTTRMSNGAKMLFFIADFDSILEGAVIIFIGGLAGTVAASGLFLATLILAGVFDSFEGGVFAKWIQFVVFILLGTLFCGVGGVLSMSAIGTMAGIGVANNESMDPVNKVLFFIGFFGMAGLGLLVVLLMWWDEHIGFRKRDKSEKDGDV